MAATTGIVWLRRDLRLVDNAALSQASQREERIAVVYIFDPDILSRQNHDGGRRRLDFIIASLQELDGELQARGSRLLVRSGNPTQELPWLARQLGATTVYWNRDYTPYARRRDAAVAASLAAVGCETVTAKDLLIFEGGEIERAPDEPYRVFTPYAKRWRGYLQPAHFAERRVYGDRYLASKQIEPYCQSWPKSEPPYYAVQPGRKAALRRLNAFLAHIDAYAEARNFPAQLQGTSGLSAHLRFGTIGIRECWRQVQARTSVGAETWRNELIWREFYQMLTLRFPYVATRNFKPETDGIVWPGRPQHFEVWQMGCTGFPIVDAALRELKASGWMHNRLRMIVASFLTKDLLLDWRLGERWFREQLLDYDFAANNGGWQWAASTGCDAQPYFRVFNPVLQSQRFDPQGDYIRRWLPELAGFDNRAIHWPHALGDAAWAMAGCRRDSDYPAPLVDHRQQKARAIALFRPAVG